MSGSQNQIDLSDKKQEKPNPEKKPQPKTITLKLEELMKWDAKSKEQASKITALTNENNTIKKAYEQCSNEYQALRKKLEEKKKNDNNVQGLQQTIKELQNILNETNIELNQNHKQKQRLKDDLRIEKEFRISRDKQIEALRQHSSEYFLLKQEVTRLANENIGLKKGRESVKELEEKVNKYEQKISEFQDQIKREKEKAETAENNNLLLFRQNTQFKQQIEKLNSEITRIQQQKQEMSERVQVLEMQVKDLEQDKEIAIKKYLLQNKQLKELVLQQKKAKQQLQEQAKQQRLEIEEKKQKQMEKYIGKNEKYFILKIEELQMKNHMLLQSTNHLSVQNDRLNKLLKDKDESILILTKEITLKWPNLQDSEGLQYVQKEIIEIGKLQKHNYGQILQKVMIENLRLKYSIQTIGSQYNEKLRKNI